MIPTTTYAAVLSAPTFPQSVLEREKGRSIASIFGGHV